MNEPMIQDYHEKLAGMLAHGILVGDHEETAVILVHHLQFLYRKEYIGEGTPTWEGCVGELVQEVKRREEENA